MKLIVQLCKLEKNTAYIEQIADLWHPFPIDCPQPKLDDSLFP